MEIRGRIGVWCAQALRFVSDDPDGWWEVVRLSLNSREGKMVTVLFCGPMQMAFKMRDDLNRPKKGKMNTSVYLVRRKS